MQTFVAAGIAVVPMHGLILGLPPGATVRPLAVRLAGSRIIDVLVPPQRRPVVDDLMEPRGRRACIRVETVS